MSLVITQSLLNDACVVFRLQAGQSGSVPGSLVCKVWLTQLISDGLPGDVSPGIKWSGRDADHSSPFSTEVKNEWIYTFLTPPYAIMVCSVNFPFTLALTKVVCIGDYLNIIIIHTLMSALLFSHILSFLTMLKVGHSCQSPCCQYM